MLAYTPLICCNSLVVSLPAYFVVRNGLMIVWKRDDLLVFSIVLPQGHFGMNSFPVLHLRSLMTCAFGLSMPLLYIPSIPIHLFPFPLDLLSLRSSPLIWSSWIREYST
ncbi:hypothetical protein O6H91_06G075500 [Diphasiastrum complanatum]|uniref:Uncharacterized protein n=1 Tax=Diphasiastrum complanatum TaxID=34168 RepID=A0ACC2DEZ1_DIPCM|nr:hypothetical protein O6H91_06G075500 [Diphasiastrum complanatum]